MPQRHPRSFPGCPTRLRGWLGRSERGSGTARSPSPDRRLFSASCHSAASAQSGTGVSHSADEADKEGKEHLKSYNSGYVRTATLCAYLQYPFQRIKIVLLTLQDRTQDTSSHQLQRENTDCWELSFYGEKQPPCKRSRREGNIVPVAAWDRLVLDRKRAQRWSSPPQ